MNAELQTEQENTFTVVLDEDDHTFLTLLLHRRLQQGFDKRAHRAEQRCTRLFEQLRQMEPDKK